MRTPAVSQAAARPSGGPAKWRPAKRRPEAAAWPSGGQPSGGPAKRRPSQAAASQADNSAGGKGGLQQRGADFAHDFIGWSREGAESAREARPETETPAPAQGPRRFERASGSSSSPAGMSRAVRSSIARRRFAMPAAAVTRATQAASAERPGRSRGVPASPLRSRSPTTTRAWPKRQESRLSAAQPALSHRSRLPARASGPRICSKRAFVCWRHAWPSDFKNPIGPKPRIRTLETGHTNLQPKPPPTLPSAHRRPPCILGHP